MNVLAFDPGTKNFGWAYKTEKYFITGMVSPTEGRRYMVRGFGTMQHELVNNLIGAIICACRAFEVPVVSLTPSTWKTAFKRQFGVSTDDIKLKGRTDHECDALGMCCHTVKDDLVKVMLACSALHTMFKREHRKRNRLLKVCTPKKYEYCKGSIFDFAKKRGIDLETGFKKNGNISM
jgi:hypothetical protein